MATFDEIKEVRLRIDDPSGFINLIEVANAAALPSSPESQTAYKLTDTGVYVATDKDPPVVSTDYETQELLVSDARISAWIDAEDVNYATCQALKNIVAKLGKRLRLVKNRAGAEETEYTSLKDTYDYYKGLLDLCESEKKSEDNNNSGRIGQMKQPEIAGGNL